MVVEANYIGSRGRQHVRQAGHQPLQRRPPRRQPRPHPARLRQHRIHATPSTRATTTASPSASGSTGSDLNLGVAYTLGKAIDRSSSATSGPQRPDAYGPDDQDEGPVRLRRAPQARRLAQLQAARPVGGRRVRRSSGGWQLAGVLLAQSGTPYSVFCTRGFVPVRNAAGAIVGNSGCDYNADGTNLDRPNVAVLRRLAQRLQRRLRERDLHARRTSRCPGSDSPAPWAATPSPGRATSTWTSRWSRRSRSAARGPAAPARGLQRLQHREPLQPRQRPGQTRSSASRRRRCRGGSSRSRGVSRSRRRRSRSRYPPRGDRASLRGVRLCATVPEART